MRVYAWVLHIKPFFLPVRIYCYIEFDIHISVGRTPQQLVITTGEIEKSIDMKEFPGSATRIFVRSLHFLCSLYLQGTENGWPISYQPVPHEKSMDNKSLDQRQEYSFERPGKPKTPSGFRATR